MRSKTRTHESTKTARTSMRATDRYPMSHRLGTRLARKAASEHAAMRYPVVTAARTDESPCGHTAESCEDITGAEVI